MTTGRISNSASSWRPSRLWRMRFDDIARPEIGGAIEMLLSSQFYADAAANPNADPSFQMFDNLTIDGFGRIILQEDVGGNDRLGRIYVYGIDSKKLRQVAVHNAKFFGGNASTNPNFLTNDEESSGIIGHRPNSSADAGNGTPPAATGCGGTARSRHARLGGGAAARRGRSRGRGLTVS